MNMDWYGLGCPALWIPAYAGMTVRDYEDFRIGTMCCIVLWILP